MTNSIKILMWAILLMATFASAQSWKNSEGELEDVRVVIEKDKELSLPAKPRKFEKIPPLPVAQEKKSFEYTFAQKLPGLTATVPDSRALSIKADPLSKLYGNYIKGGYGNYNNSLLKGYFTNKRDHRYATGLLFDHRGFGRGAVDGPNSGFNYLHGKFFNDVYGKKIKVASTGGYTLWNDRFYGYDQRLEIPDTFDLRQNTQLVEVNVEVTNFNARNWKTRAVLDFDYLQNKFDISSIGGKLSFDTEYEASDDIDYFLRSSAYLDQVVDRDTIVRGLYKIFPGFRIAKEKFVLSAGVNLVIQDDTVDNVNPVFPYPMIDVEYEINDLFDVKAGLRGDVEATALPDFARENRLLKGGNQYHFRTLDFEVYGEARARIGAKWNASGGFSLSGITNQSFYVFDHPDSGDFRLTYDKGQVGLFNLWGQVQSYFIEDLNIRVRGDYYGYDTEEVSYAWHRPEYRLSAGVQYFFRDQVHFTTRFDLTGGIIAPDEQMMPVYLDPVISWGLDLEYLFTDRFSTYLNFNNLLNQPNQFYLGYPQPGINFNIGISYAF